MQSTLCALVLPSSCASTTTSSPNRDPILTKIFHLRWSSAEKILRRNEASVTVLRLNVPLQFLAQIMSTYYFWQEELRSVQSHSRICNIEKTSFSVWSFPQHLHWGRAFVMEKRVKGLRIRMMPLTLLKNVPLHYLPQNEPRKYNTLWKLLPKLVLPQNAYKFLDVGRWARLLLCSPYQHALYWKMQDDTLFCSAHFLANDLSIIPKKKAH